MIPESFIQELLARVDIVGVIERYVPLRKGGANYLACCPFHGEKTPSFTVSPTKQFYHCFGCGAHGSAIGFLMQYAGLGFVDAVEDLANSVGLKVPSTREDRGVRTDTVSLVELMARAARYYREQLKHHARAVDYLKRRGLTGEVAAHFGIGYAPDGWQNLAGIVPDYQAKDLVSCGLVIEGDGGKRYDRFRDRIMFPIVNGRGNVIGFGGRVIDQGEPKYLNSPETPLFEKGRELYGLSQARTGIRDAGSVIVVEGYMDVVALAQHGVENCVATLGTATTPHHVQKLLRQADRIVFCFDGDNAGRKAAWRALEASLEHAGDDKLLSFLFLPQEDDPDTYVRAHGAAGFRDAAARALPLTAFMLSGLKAQADLGSAEGKSRLVHNAKPLLKRISAPLLRLQLVKSIAQASGFSTQEIEAACELKPLVRARTPARSARRAPSPVERKLLLLLVQRPELVARLPLDVLQDDAASPELQAVRALVDDMENGAAPAGGVGPLLERFRGTDHEATFSELVPELNEEYFDEVSVEDVFSDTVESLRRSRREREFAELQRKIVSKAPLTPQELARYRELIASKPLSGAVSSPSAL